MSEIVVVARGRARAGREAEAEQAFLEVMTPTHGEEGCLRYALHRDLGDPQQFWMLERWSSKEALDRHLASDHVQRLFEQLESLLESPAELNLLSPKSDHLGQRARI